MGTDNSPSEKTVTSWICTSNTTADMNAKYVVALILALQVSMSLCEIPEPSQELVEKYEQMKSTFLKRLMNAFERVSKSPVVENNREAVVALAGNLHNKPELNAAAGVATALAEEAPPLLDKARSSVLGVYEYYLRPYVGNTLSDGIDHVKVVLDKYLPAE